MVQDYLARASSDRASYPLGRTTGAILMSEASGRTAYLFFAVFASYSRMCTEPGAGPASRARVNGATCVLAHVFEAQYDVSGTDFSAMNDFYSPSYGTRRRLLHAEGYGPRRKVSWKEGVFGAKRRRRRLGPVASASSSSHSGAVQSLTCRTLVPRPPSCKPGTAAFPRCTVICVPRRTSGPKK